MNSPAQVLFFARHHLASLLRQRETLLWVFGMPLLFFWFIGSVTGGMGGPPSGERREPLALVHEGVPAPLADGQGGFLVQALAARLAQQGFVPVPRAQDEELAEGARALFLPPVPAGHASLTDALLAGQALELRLREGGGSPASSSFDRLRVGRAVYGLVADLALAPRATELLTPDELSAFAGRARPLTLRVEAAGERRHVPTGYEQTIPGTLVMFTLLVLLTGGSIQLVVERRQGLLRRLAAAPVERGPLVAGKWLGMLLLGLVQIAFAMVVGRVVFGLDWGPSLPAVVGVLVSWAMFCASLAVLLACVVRSEAQMSGLGVLLSLLLAALGGCWWPIEVTPGWMQTLARFLPTGQAMDAMHLLVSFGRGPASVLPHCAVLLAGSVVLGALAARRFRFD